MTARTQWRAGRRRRQQRAKRKRRSRAALRRIARGLLAGVSANARPWFQLETERFPPVERDTYQWPEFVPTIRKLVRDLNCGDLR